MVVHATRSISRDVRKSSTIATMVKDTKAAYCLNRIYLPGANYLGPLIPHFILSLFWGLIIIICIHLLKITEFTLYMLAPFFIIPLSAIIAAVFYKMFFKLKYTETFYFSVGMYKYVYIWPIIVSFSIFYSLWRTGGGIFGLVHLSVFSSIASFFLRTQFHENLVESPKHSFLFFIYNAIDTLFFGALMLYFSAIPMSFR